MLKFLSTQRLYFQVKTSCSISNKIIQNNTMSRRYTRRSPKFKPEVKIINSNPKFGLIKPTFDEKKLEVLPSPIKSLADKKLYKTVKLPNGLVALLISDPSTVVDDPAEDSDLSDSGTDSEYSSSDGEKSNASAASDTAGTKRSYNEEKLAAVSLTVGVGSYSDPPDIQGLAHFVEHMVFMGSSKYPKENQFDSFIKKKGGSDNASTDCEMTTFYFEIPERHLPQAMDMFSQFFVSPLMLKEAMQREREAIESEFAIATPSDSNRKDQLLASFFPEGHPARTFVWGNLQSLKDDIGDDDKLYKAAHEFRKRHYSAHRMTVSVQARMDLSRLEEYVINTFGHIPTNNLPPSDFSAHHFSLNSTVTPEFSSMYYMKPMSDASELCLTWCIRSLISEYESKPHQYISYLLGHEGKGSLLSYLRKKVWALGIYTGTSESGIDYTSMYSLFSTQIVLTKQGLEHVDEVIEATFSYLNMIRQLGPSEEIFSEIQTIENNSFRFEEEMQPVDYVEKLSENMHMYPPQHYITGDKIYYKYDPEGIIKVLDEMQAYNANILVLSNKHSTPIVYDQKEKWFGTEYRKEEIPKLWLKRWQEAKPKKQFHLPEKNIFITTNFDILPTPEPYARLAKELDIDLNVDSPKEMHEKMAKITPKKEVFKKGNLIATVNHFRLDQPNLLRKNRNMELWYKPDFKWRFPTALLYFYFITPLSLKSPRESCLLDLWNDVLHQQLKEDVYPAEMADLAHSISISDKGFTMKVLGHSQNLHLLVDLIGRGMRDTALGRIEGSLFDAVKEVRERYYHNTLIKPHKLAKDLRMDIIVDPYISPRMKAVAIQNVTVDDLIDFSGRLFKTMYLSALVQGNLGWDDAVLISENLYKQLNWNPLEEEEIPRLHVLQLPNGEHRLRVRSFNKLSANSMITNYYQAELSTEKDTAILEILMMLMEEPVFDTLRTKEQLGYSVFSMMRYTFGVLGYSVSVNAQADKFTVSHVDKRVETFLAKFARQMSKLSEHSLNSTKNSLVQLKHTVDYELKEEVERHWREIVSGEYQFQRLLKEANAIETVKLSEVKAWVDNHFSTGNKSMFRKLSIQVSGNIVDKNATNQTTTDPDLKNFDLQFIDSEGTDDSISIRDIETFKRNLNPIKVPLVKLENC